MTIAFVSLMEGFPWGGSEELWCKSAMLALEQNERVCFSTKYWGERTPQKIEALISKGATPYYRNLPPITHSISYRAVRKIKRTLGVYTPKPFDPWVWIRVEKPRVVCINMGGPFDVIRQPQLMTLLRNENIPFVIIQQFNFEHHILRDDARHYAKQLFLEARKVFFVSRRNKEVTERTLAVRLPNAVQISNPVNLKSIDLVEYPAVEKCFNLAMVARLDVAYKGHDIVLSMLSMPKWRNENWHLNLYGAGPDTNYIKELINLFDLQDKVTFHGNSNDIREIWKANHVLVLPSYAEGTPLALIEAMVCGRTAVVTNVGGNADLIDDLATGFVADSPSVESFEIAFTNAWEQKDRSQQMGERARDAVLKKINFESHVELLQVLRDSSK